MSDRLVRLRIPKLADPPRPIRVKGRDTGATLIEALIAMIVISIGLLGIAALQTKALQSTANSKATSIEAIRAADLGERLWAVSCRLAKAVDDSTRRTIATRTRDQWIKDHYEIDMSQQQPDPDCRLPDCCPYKVCFVDPPSLDTQQIEYVEPGETHPEYFFKMEYGHHFSVVLPPHPSDCP